MGWTKRDIIQSSLTELGLGPRVYSHKPELLTTALRVLDGLMEEWRGKNIEIGYPAVTDPRLSYLSDDTRLPAYAIEAVRLHLAIRLAPQMGRDVMPETRQRASVAYDALITHLDRQPKIMRLPVTTPLGQGNKPWRFYRGEYVVDTEEEMPAPAPASGTDVTTPEVISVTYSMPIPFRISDMDAGPDEPIFIRWEGLELDPGDLGTDPDARIRRIRLLDNDDIQEPTWILFYEGGTPREGPPGTHDLIPAWESNPKAIQLEASHGFLILPGPTLWDPQDFTEPYRGVLPDGAERLLETWVRNLSLADRNTAGAIKLTLSTG